jgi:transitional endoplasmic reticulum ATPase
MSKIDDTGEEREMAEESSAKRPKKVNIGKVERHGEAIVIPEKMPIKAAVEILERQMKYEEESVEVQERFDCFPWDGALAFVRVVERRYGFVMAEKTMSFFGPEPPKVISIQTGPEKFENVVWGEFSLPNMEGKLNTASVFDKGLFKFVLHGIIKRKHEENVRQIAVDIREYLKSNSIYKGQGLAITFPSAEMRQRVPANIRFLDLRDVKAEELVFSSETMADIEDQFFCFIEQRKEVLAHGVPEKRGILLEGPPGTGKTLAAMVGAKKATDRGMTVWYCPNIKDFEDTVRLASLPIYKPGVIFCEDIDRVTSGERDEEFDKLLNILDGIETKKAGLLVVLTSNSADAIKPVAVRPGRIDSVIKVQAPDPVAVEKLIRLYARGFLAPEVDLKAACAVLDGQIPAVIREVVERAKLSAIRRAPEASLQLTGEDLLRAAKSMSRQLELLNRKPSLGPHEMELFGRGFGAFAAAGLREVIAGFLSGDATKVEQLNALAKAHLLETVRKD